MTIALWGGGSPDDLADPDQDRRRRASTSTGRSGSSAGTSPPTSAGRRSTCSAAGWRRPLVGAVLFDLRYPAGPLVVGRRSSSSVALALLVSFAHPVPGRDDGVLDPRRPGHRGAGERAGGLLQRPDRAAGAVPGLVRRPGPGAAVGGVPPGARGPLAGQATRAGPCSASLGLQALWAVVLLAGCRAAAPRGRAQGGGPGWLRPPWTLPLRPDLRALGPGRPGLPRVVRGCSWSAAFLITGVDFVGIWILFQNVDDARRLRPARGRVPVRRQRARHRLRRPVRGPGRAARPDDPARASSTR